MLDVTVAIAEQAIIEFEPTHDDHAFPIARIGIAIIAHGPIEQRRCSATTARSP
jgi:hypothetical protein